MTRFVQALRSRDSSCAGLEEFQATEIRINTGVSCRVGLYSVRDGDFCIVCVFVGPEGGGGSWSWSSLAGSANDACHCSKWSMLMKCCCCFTKKALREPSCPLSHLRA